MNERADQRTGFTLVELLVSLAIFTLLSVALFGIVSQVSSTWQQAQARIELRKSGRAILDYISRELQIAQLPADRSMRYDSTTAKPQTAQLNLQFLINPTDVTSQFLNPQAAFWQIPAAENVTPGMAEVGYFVRWDTRVAGKPKAMLCRYFASAGDPQNLIYSSPENWISDAIINAVAPGIADSTNAVQSYRGWFADNVVGLWLKPLDPLEQPITTNALGVAYSSGAYDSRKGYTYKNSLGTDVIQSGYKNSGTDWQILATLPAAVDVSLVILDSPSAARLTAVPIYSAATTTDARTFVKSLPETVRSGARIYSTRIKMNH